MSICLNKLKLTFQSTNVSNFAPKNMIKPLCRIGANWSSHNGTYGSSKRTTREKFGLNPAILGGYRTSSKDLERNVSAIKLFAGMNHPIAK